MPPGQLAKYTLHPLLAVGHRTLRDVRGPRGSSQTSSDDGLDDLLAQPAGQLHRAQRGQ